MFSLAGLKCKVAHAINCKNRFTKMGKNEQNYNGEICLKKRFYRRSRRNIATCAKRAKMELKKIQEYIIMDIA